MAPRALIDNTRRFAKRLPANNALLWGARGMGKSSLVKAAHAEVRGELVTQGKKRSPDLKLVEIHREDIATLPRCLSHLKGSRHRFIVFSEDLSFDKDDTSYKSLKAMLEGGIEGRPDNVVFYATSNRRHLMPRDMAENERSTAIAPSEAGRGEGLALRPPRPLARISQLQPGPVSRDGGELCRSLPPRGRERRARAPCARVEHHARRPFGPVAWQFIQDLAGRLGRTLATS